MHHIALYAYDATHRGQDVSGAVMAAEDGIKFTVDRKHDGAFNVTEENMRVFERILRSLNDKYFRVYATLEKGERAVFPSLDAFLNEDQLKYLTVESLDFNCGEFSTILGAEISFSRFIGAGRCTIKVSGPRDECLRVANSLEQEIERTKAGARVLYKDRGALVFGVGATLAWAGFIVIDALFATPFFKLLGGEKAYSQTFYNWWFAFLLVFAFFEMIWSYKALQYFYPSLVFMIGKGKFRHERAIAARKYLLSAPILLVLIPLLVNLLSNYVQSNVIDKAGSDNKDSVTQQKK